jgi:hypothetical protein
VVAFVDCQERVTVSPEVIAVRLAVSPIEGGNAGVGGEGAAAMGGVATVLWHPEKTITDNERNIA